MTNALEAKSLSKTASFQIERMFGLHFLAGFRTKIDISSDFGL